MVKKIIRVFTAILPVDKRRRGACNGCGACCKIVFTCPFLTRDANGLARCAIYRFRPPACRKYPRTACEWSTPEKCGFSFVEQPAECENAAPLAAQAR